MLFCPDVPTQTNHHSASKCSRPVESWRSGARAGHASVAGARGTVVGIACSVLLAIVFLFVRPAFASFIDVTSSAGISVRTLPQPRADYGSGAAFADFNGDGTLDLYVVMGKGQPNRLYMLGGSGRFTDDAAASGCADAGWGTSVKVADYDNDGDVDIFLVNNGGPDRLYRNDGTGHFTDVTAAAGVAFSAESHGASWADTDRDGYLDLYVVVHARVANPYYHNNGDGTFTEEAAAAGIADVDKPGYECAWVDIDNDGDLDLYISEDKMRGNDLYLNNGDGTFTDISASSGAGLAMNGMGIATGDYDSDGFVDMFVTNTPEGHALFHNNRDGTFTNVATSAGVTANRIGWGTAFFDQDNDGDLDLYVVHWAMSSMQNPANILFRNDGGGSFTDITAGSGAGNAGLGFGLAVGDYNHDGAEDLFVVNRDSASVLLQNVPTAAHWLKIRPVGRIGNRDGIGARIRVTTGALTQQRDIDGGSGYLSCNERVAAFGLGGAAMADRVAIAWPSGVVDVLTAVPADQTVVVREGQSTYTSGTFIPTRATRGLHVTQHGTMGRDFGNGLAFGDIDNDGDDDLYVGNGTGFAATMYRNDNGHFTDITAQAKLGDTANGKTPAFADFDNDGDLDLFVCTYGAANRMYRNNGDGTFTNIAATAGLAYTGNSSAAAWGDYNRDGLIDLYVANYREADRLYRNNGDGTFTDVTVAAGIDNPRACLVAAWIDYDNDRDLDLFTAVDKLGGNVLYRNNGDGTFTDVSAAAGANQAMNAMGIAVGDYDRDGFMDMYVTNTADGHVLLHNNGDGTFTDVAPALGMTANRIGWGTAFFDSDNDGDVDLYVVHWGMTPGSANNMLFRNNGNGSFTDISAGAKVNDGGNGFGLALADINSDGVLDFVVGNQNTPAPLYEAAPNGNHWLKIRTHGVTSNRDGIGARVEVITGSVRQIRDVGGGSSYLSHHSLDVSVGVGLTTSIDTVRVLWPRGFIDEFSDVPVDRVLDIHEGDSRAPLAFPALTAQPESDGATLSWSVSWTFGVNAYRVFRRLLPGGVDSEIATLMWTPGNVTFRDTSAVPGTTYEYRVDAVLSQGGEVSSTPILITTLRSALAFSYIHAQRDPSGIFLEWTVNREEDVAGFVVDRTEAVSGRRTRVSGTSMIPSTRRFFRDRTAEPSRDYTYTVSAIRVSDGSEVSSTAIHVRTPAASFALRQNYPNPFNPSTSISFTVPDNANVTLVIFDAAGRRVRTLLSNRAVRAGLNAVSWDGTNNAGQRVPSGVYFYALSWRGQTATRKMVRVH